MGVGLKYQRPQRSTWGDAGRVAGHVPDIETARAEFVDCGVEVSEPFHFGPEGQTPGFDPGRADYRVFVWFSDPHGNGWLIQEVKPRAPGR